MHKRIVGKLKKRFPSLKMENCVIPVLKQPVTLQTKRESQVSRILKKKFIEVLMTNSIFHYRPNLAHVHQDPTFLPFLLQINLLHLYLKSKALPD